MLRGASRGGARRDSGAEGRGLWLGDRRIDVAVVVDRWLGPDHRYFKLECDAGDTYIVRHDLGRDTWELTMFRAGTLK